MAGQLLQDFTSPSVGHGWFCTVSLLISHNIIGVAHENTASGQICFLYLYNQYIYIYIYIYIVYNQLILVMNSPWFVFNLRISPAPPREAVQHTRVFARVSPIHKQVIVQVAGAAACCGHISQGTSTFAGFFQLMQWLGLGPLFWNLQGEDVWFYRCNDHRYWTVA